MSRNRPQAPRRWAPLTTPDLEATQVILDVTDVHLVSWSPPGSFSLLALRHMGQHDIFARADLTVSHPQD